MNRLRELREARHLNQQRLAMEFNITQAAISKYELGLSEPDIHMLKKMADYFHVSIDYLTEFSDCPTQCFKSDLPIQELNLINKFRRMDYLQKEKTLAYMQGLLQE